MKYVSKKVWGNLSYEDLRKLDKQTLLLYTKSAIREAKRRQTTLDKNIEREFGDYIPSSFRDFGKNFNKKYGKYAKKEDLENYAGYDFSLDNKEIKNITYLRYKFARAQNFINAKTSTIGGIRDTIKKTVSTLEEKIGDLYDNNGNKINMKEFVTNKEKFSLLWKVYNRLDTSYITGAQRYNAVLKYLVKTIDSSIYKLNEETLLQNAKNLSDIEYEKEFDEEYDEDDGFEIVF